MEKTDDTAVLFNADCPVCNFEISHYADYAAKNGLPIRFDDLNSDALARWDLTADQAARRLYVVHQGALFSGIEGFLVLWRQMPKYHWLAKVVGLPVVKQIAAVVYDYVLAPLIYRWHLRRQAKR
jgi:predicted DCC family thiol-disulfide oxidoreductase YuxK